MPRTLRRDNNWSRGPGRRRRRLTGCLLWIAGLIIILIILALLFGGFQKGTKAGLHAGTSASHSLPRFAPAPLLAAGQPAGHARYDRDVTVG